MIPSHVILNSKKFGDPDQASTLLVKALHNTKYYIKTTLGTVKTAYFANKIYQLYGTEQGAGSSEPHWFFISASSMKILEKGSKWCKIISPKKVK